MPHEGNLLQAAVVFLFAAVLTVPLAKRLQLGAVIWMGYFVVNCRLAAAGLPSKVVTPSSQRAWSCG